MKKSLLRLAIIGFCVFAWACGSDDGSISTTSRSSAADLFGNETDPFEVVFTPDVSVSDDAAVTIYWREANGVRRIDVVSIQHTDGELSGAFVVEPTTPASEQTPGRTCRWGFARSLVRSDNFFAECEVYTGGLTLNGYLDAFLRLMESSLESEPVNESVAGREAICMDVKGSGNLPEGFQVQKGRVCLGIEPSVPLYMANDTKALKFSATNVTLPLSSTDFVQDVPAVPVGNPYPTVRSLRLPESAEQAVIAYRTD